MVKISANLGFLWPELPLLQRIDAAGAAGFGAVELHVPYDVPPDAVRDACARNGVRLLNINTDFGRGAEGRRGVAAVPGREAEFAGLVDQAVGWASAAGGTSVQATAGIVAEAEHDRAREVIVANLRAAAPKAAEKGLTLLLEPLNLRTAPGYFLSRVEQAVDIIEAVGAPNVKVMFDIFHIGIQQGDVLTRLRTNIGHIHHIQIAAVPSRHEPDEGEINYPAIFAELDALGYPGWVGAEYAPRAGTDAGLGWIEAFGLTL